MTLVGDRSNTTTPRAEHEGAEDPWIRVHEILQIHHAHPPSPSAVTFHGEPESQEACLAARQANIQQFRFEGELRWVDFSDITSYFERKVGRGREYPYKRSEVFAPVKVVFAEASNPIRAVLTYEPVYPWQNKLGVPKPGQRLWLVYAAVAVLNSIYGQAYYSTLMREHPTRSLNAHGLKMAPLRRVPVAKRNYSFEELSGVAGLTHQLIALHDAEQECLPYIFPEHRVTSSGPESAWRHFTTVFKDQRKAVDDRLKEQIRLLLGLHDEQEEQNLLDALRVPGPTPEQQPSIFHPLEFLEQLPLPPPVRLLSEDDEARLLELTKSPGRPRTAGELNYLRQVRFWQGVINNRPPYEVGLVPAGEGRTP